MYENVNKIIKSMCFINFLRCFLIYFLIIVNFCGALKLFKMSNYSTYTLDDNSVCNETIFLKEGSKSAALFKLTEDEFYDFSKARRCTVTFHAPIHHWSGLTAVVEEVDLRKYDDVSHRTGSSQCVDYIMLETDTESYGPNHRQCGTWSISTGETLSKVGYQRALVGYCPRGSISAKKCQVNKLKVLVSIGEENFPLLRNYSWGFHKGFSIVVTAYSYPTQNGETECRDGLTACSKGDASSNLGQNHCIHHSFWCDGHVNCAIQERMDEKNCFPENQSWAEILSIVIGPWMGATFLLVLLIGGGIYLKSKPKRTRDTLPSGQDINSYAESYELSSNIPSAAHNMAIQVRVVCNSNHPHRNLRDGRSRWKQDMPPAYDSLFPGGPPESTTSPNVTTSIVATVQEGACSTVGVNVTSSAAAPNTSNTLTSQTAAGINSVQRSRSVSPRGDSIEGATSSSSVNHERNASPRINLNVIQNESSNAGNQNNDKDATSTDERTSSAVDATITAGSTQTSVTVKVTPPQSIVPRDTSAVEDNVQGKKEPSNLEIDRSTNENNPESEVNERDQRESQIEE